MILIDKLCKADLYAMISSMRDKGLAANSIQSYTRTLKSFFSWCNESGITRLNMARYKAEETVKGTYSDEELKKLLVKPDMKKCGFAEYRNWVIINLLLNNGCRAATIRNIQTKDVEIENIVFAPKYRNRHFWCRGYYVSTVGRNRCAVEQYIRNQLQEDLSADQMSISEYIDPFMGKPVKEGK